MGGGQTLTPPANYDLDNLSDEGLAKLGGLPTFFNLFDTRITDHILQGEGLRGWALQGTYVNKSEYPSFYGRCLEEYQNSEVIEQYKNSNVDIKGTLIDTNGVLTAFSATSYAKLPNVFNPSTNSWEFVTRIMTPASFGTRNLSVIGSGITTGADYQGFTFSISTTGKIRTYISSNGSKWDIASQVLGTDTLATSTEYYVKFEFTGQQYIVSISSDGKDWRVQSTITSSTPIYVSSQPLILGGNFYSSANAEFYVTDGGYIDLNYTYIKIGDEIWWRGINTNSYKQNINGHKFYNIVDKSFFDEMFNNIGITDFYGIDEENERVFLPRNKYFAVTGGVMGTGMTLGLTDGEINAGLYQADYLHTYTGCYGKSVGSSATSGSVVTRGESIGITTDSTKSGIVLEPNENKYLYYCVGNIEVTQAITNVVEITESENDSNPLGSSFYFNNIQPNAGWLKSSGQWNDGNVYTTFYNWLVNEKTTNTLRADIKDVSEEYTDYDYVLNQDEMNFRLPLLNGSESVAKGSINDEYAKPTSSGQTYTALHNSTIQVYATTDATNQYIRVHNITTGEFDEKRPGISGVGTDVAVWVNKGDTFKITGDKVSTVNFVRGHQAQGNGSLYFKVANAVQNLELLDAGEVLEGLADKVGFSNTEWVINACMPDYNSPIDITSSLTADSAYTVPFDGVIRFYASQDVEWFINQDKNNSDSNKALIFINGASGVYIDSYLTVYKTQTLYIRRKGTSAIFYPLKGAK